MNSLAKLIGLLLCFHKCLKKFLSRKWNQEDDLMNSLAPREWFLTEKDSIQIKKKKKSDQYGECVFPFLIDHHFFPTQMTLIGVYLVELKHL